MTARLALVPLMASVLLATSGTPHASAPALLDDQCICDLRTENSSTTIGTPPACYNDTTFVFDSGYDNKDGECNISPCTTRRTCLYKLIVTSTAKPGQTCNFQIVFPGPGPQPTPCNNQPSCSATTIIKQLACGNEDEYIVKIDGTVVAAKLVVCKQCMLE